MQSIIGIFRVPDIRNKLWITLGILFVYRMGTFITIPGIDVAQLNRLFEQLQQHGGVGRVMQMADMFSGGAIGQAAVFSLGIWPYITASILFQILASVYPELKKLQKEGESGRRKINQYTRYATLAICLFQAFMICRFLEKPISNVQLVSYTGPLFIFVGIACLTTGTMIIMWLGEMITEFGLGNGISVIIMGGIVARLPHGIFNYANQFKEAQAGSGYLTVAFLFVFFLLVVVAIIYTTLGQRRIPIRQARRAVGASFKGGNRQYLPLRVNMAGVIPIIFAQSLIMFPALLANIPGFARLKDYFNPGQASWTLSYLVLIVFFCFFYTSIVFSPSEMADNMKQGGTFIPGIRPGQETMRFFEMLLTRITVVGATVLAVIAIIPQFLSQGMQINYDLAGIFGGTGLLIVVGVALDLIQKIEGQMLTHSFGSLLESSRARGR